MTMQKETLEHDTKVVIYSEKTKELTKEVFIYLQDLNGDGELFFNVDYEVEHKNGSFENGNGIPRHYFRCLWF